MKTISLLLIALFGSAFSSFRAETKLIVDVQNIKEVKGQLRVGLYKPCDDFPMGCKPIANQIVAVNGSSTRVTFTVPPGDYAVALFHDVNDNGQMDKKMFGIPKEPYGFSNNYRPRVSGPNFDDCRIQVGGAGKTISIKLI
ncbi:DUF2141 domain-containing protein [Larkinella harenae]